MLAVNGTRNAIGLRPAVRRTRRPTGGARASTVGRRTRSNPNSPQPAANEPQARAAWTSPRFRPARRIAARGRDTEHGRSEAGPPPRDAMEQEEVPSRLLARAATETAGWKRRPRLGEIERTAPGSAATQRLARPADVTASRVTEACESSTRGRVGPEARPRRRDSCRTRDTRSGRAQPASHPDLRRTRPDSPGHRACRLHAHLARWSNSRGQCSCRTPVRLRLVGGPDRGAHPARAADAPRGRTTFVADPLRSLPPVGRRPTGTLARRRATSLGTTVDRDLAARRRVGPRTLPEADEDRPETAQRCTRSRRGECSAIVDGAPATVSGPRPLDAPAMQPGGCAGAWSGSGPALAGLRLQEAPRGTRDARRLRAHLTASNPLLQRLATDDVAWELTLPGEAVYVGASAIRVERCLTATRDERSRCVATRRPAGALRAHARTRQAPIFQAVRRLDAVLVLDAQGYGI